MESPVTGRQSPASEGASLQASLPPVELVGKRLEWAQRRIDDFQREVERWSASNPVSFPREWDEQAATEYIRLKVERPLPPALPFLAAEAVHHMRAALDNFAYAIGSAGASEREKRQIYFPVCSEVKDLPKSLRSCDGRVEAAIQAVQPYNCGDAADSWLGILNDLWNADKHRGISVFCIAPGTLQFFDCTSNRKFDPKTEFGPLQDGSVFVRIRSMDRLRPDLKPRLTIDVCFESGSAANNAGLWVLRKIHWEIRKMLAQLYPNAGFTDVQVVP